MKIIARIVVGIIRWIVEVNDAAFVVVVMFGVFFVASRFTAFEWWYGVFGVSISTIWVVLVASVTIECIYRTVQRLQSRRLSSLECIYRAVQRLQSRRLSSFRESLTLVRGALRESRSQTWSVGRSLNRALHGIVRRFRSTAHEVFPLFVLTSLLSMSPVTPDVLRFNPAANQALDVITVVMLVAVSGDRILRVRPLLKRLFTR